MREEFRPASGFSIEIEAAGARESMPCGYHNDPRRLAQPGAFWWLVFADGLAMAPGAGRGGSVRGDRSRRCNLCASRINPPSAPRTPRLRRLRRDWGKPVRARGPAIAFIDAGMGGECQKPVDSMPRHHANPDSTKGRAWFPTFKTPRVGMFCPRVTPFFPHVIFCSLRPILLHSSSFKRERERREGPQCGKWQSTGPISCSKKHPRVRTPIHGFSVDCFLGNREHWRGLAAGLPAIHASTERNAPPTLEGGSP